MVAPRLTLVKGGSTVNDNAPGDDDSIEAAEARELAAALADAQVGLAPEDAPHHDEPGRASPNRDKLRILEAVIFAATEPVDEKRLAASLSKGDDVPALIEELRQSYQSRGVNLVKVAGKWTFRTAEDLSYLLEKHAVEERRLSKAALETLAIVAYHQPVTRAEIEEVRGVSTSAGTLDILMETGWVRPRGRRRAPGKPITYGTTDAFLEHFGLDGVKDLPGLAELKGTGLLDANLPPGFSVPEPRDLANLMPDELPLEAGEEDGVQAEMELGLPDEDNPAKPDEETD